MSGFRATRVQLGALVLLRGLVEGMGREAPCQLLARRLPLAPEARLGPPGFSTYTDCSVVGTPEELPDGEYVASFEGYRLHVSLHHGLWLSRGEAARTENALFCD